MKDLNKLAKRVHRLHKNWWKDLKTGKPILRNKGELLMLTVTELSEAVEGIRKNLMDDKLPHRKMEEVEMADAAIRLLDFAGGFNLRLTTLAPQLGHCRENKAEHILDITRVVCDASIGRGARVATRISWALSRIDGYCQYHQLDLMGAIREKLQYNKTRKDHKLEARRQANGKRF